jgi:dynein heavy chain
VKLWAHETLRVFGDRLNSFEDRDKFKGYMNDQITNIFQLSYAENCTTKDIDAIFVDFMNENLPVYDDVHDFDRLREFLNDKLAQHNSTPRFTPMNLVLFKDAISHVCRIYRILSIKRGHAFLVGVGGSGRHSLTKLAAYICVMNVF